MCVPIEKRRNFGGLHIGPELLEQLLPSGFLREGMRRALRHSQRLYLETGAESPKLDCTKFPALEYDYGSWFGHNPSDYIPSLMLPNFRKPLLQAAHADVQLDCAGLGCALERHRLRHGAFPATLAGLDPQVLAKVPADPLWGAPPDYRLNPDGGYTLTFKNTDCADCAPGTERTTGKDVVWVIPGRTAP